MAVALYAADKKAIQRVLGVTQDGNLTSTQIKKLQNNLAVSQDGKLGPVTFSALQKWLGVTADGKWGPNTRKAAQTTTKRFLPTPLAPITVTDPGFHVPDFTTIKVNTSKIAIALLGIGSAVLFAFAARSSRSRA